MPESGLPYEAGVPANRVTLGDTGLVVEAERDEAGGDSAILPGWGGTMRDGLGVRAERGGVELAVTGGLLLDPVLGVRHASLGVTGGRITAVGRAGNPDTMDGVDPALVIGPSTEVLSGNGRILTAGCTRFVTPCPARGT